MDTITDIFRNHSEKYLERYGDSIPTKHIKVITQ